MFRTACALIVFASLTPGVAMAFPQFQKEWDKLYLDDNSDKEFVKLVKKEVKCWVCHQGKKKSHHNPYGKHFVGVIGKKDKKDVDKIVATLQKVAKMHSDPKNEESPTYGELISKGQLPGGKLEDAKKEPPKEEKEKDKE